MIKGFRKHSSAVLTFAALLSLPPVLQAQLAISPEGGFTITWNGNEGDYFSEEETAPVPANLATADGAAALTSGDLGPELGIAYHVAENINDGIYGNSNSWLGGSATDGPPFAGVNFGSLVTVSRFAFGRDNGNAATDPTTAGANSGQLTDRCLGVYTVQITRVVSPDAATEDTGDAATGWQTVGTLDYTASEDAEPGGGFTAWYRHEFGLKGPGGADVQATALRLLVPATGIAGGTAIDEIEVYNTPGVVLDADGDGFDDTVEVALGFNPNDPNSTPESASTALSAIEFRFYAAKTVKYFIEESADLKVWNPVETGIIGNGEAVRRLYFASDQAKRYFRAKRE